VINVYSKKRKTSSLKYKIKIAGLIIGSVLTVIIIAMIPAWISPKVENQENANFLVRNTFYTVTPRDSVIGIEILLDDLIIGNSVYADVVWDFGVDLLVERLLEYNLSIEIGSMLYFVNANEIPMKNVTGFVFYYTDTLLYPTPEIFGIDAININFTAVQTAGIQVQVV